MSTPTYPGVYVNEIPSGVHTITGVATSVTAFIGSAPKGPLNEAVDVTSILEYGRTFGGLSLDSPMSFAVRDFFQNGGGHAVIVRVFHSAGMGLSAADRPAALAALAKVTDAAAAAQDGKSAKEAAAAALAAVVADNASTTAAKTLAGKANDALAALADDASAADVAKAAGAAKDELTQAASVSDTYAMTVGSLTFAAASPGKWGAGLRISVQASSGAAAAEVAQQYGLKTADLFNLTVTDSSPGGASEQYLNVTVKNSPSRIDRVLANSSSLIQMTAPDLDKGAPALPDFGKVAGDPITQAAADLQAAQKAKPPNQEAVGKAQDAYNAALSAALASVADSAPLDDTDFVPTDLAASTGIFSLEQLFARDGIFNLLCIPPYSGGDVAPDVVAAAASYCEKRRAMLLVDAPSAWSSVQQAMSGYSAATDQVGTRSRNAAIYFPRLNMPNPLLNDQTQSFSATGMVAGIFARIDAQRGVWKSPAGLDASLSGISSLSVPMTDDDNGLLNPLGINCLRTFPVYGSVIWGARTLHGADAYADDYKYTAVRRTALFIEESLYRALKWVVFEPNDEPLWGQIRLNVGAFMQTLYRKGAFAGASARLAYFVQCDAGTTTQNDVNLGIVNINVGFAPLKPAEFVVINLQQMAGQIAT
ncbi:phage tail sheath family protein [Paraburkholderia sp. JPY432]|uniref:phage tail sheath family protein n=1 Tax=Paraburkholderia youngii TaxID=2782701 RepID=UPI0015953E64|nr:phage tail sheath subtilisin-like domain-containing protein [Paraburkholderia youngii]NVH74216.1 phage tail sheath family protein [Paraburkholderia youngii]